MNPPMAVVDAADEASVRAVLAGHPDDSMKDEDGCTALHYAADEDAAAIVELELASAVFLVA